MASFPNFFDLPAELREQILSHLCFVPDGIHIGKSPPLSESSHTHADLSPWYGTTAGAAVPFPLNLFLVGLQFYQEASGVYFGRNTFHLYTTGRHQAARLFSPETGVLASPAFLPSRRRIRHAVLYVRRIGGHLQHAVAPPLFDMMLSGRLRLLDVRFLEPHSRSEPDVFDAHGDEHQGLVVRASALAQTEPFRTLLRLLADPDLERTSLAVVAKGHLAVWCPFHARHEWEKRSPMHAAVDSKAKVDGRVGWLEVDVHALLEAYGGVIEQLRVHKVGD